MKQSVNMNTSLAKALHSANIALAVALLSGCGGGGDGSDNKNTEAPSTKPPVSSTDNGSSNAGSGNNTDSGNNTGSGNTGSETNMVGLSWATPAAMTFGERLTTQQLNATAKVPGTFSYSPSIGTKFNAGTHRLEVTFTPSDASNQPPVRASVDVIVQKADPIVLWDKPKNAGFGSWINLDHFTPVALSPTERNPDQKEPTANKPNNWITLLDGDFTFTPNPKGGIRLETLGDRTLSATFTPKDSNNYNSVSKTQVLTVVRADPPFKWEQPQPVVQGTALSATQLNAIGEYGVQGTYAYTPALNTRMNTVGDQVLSVTFTPTLTGYKTITRSVLLSVVPQEGSAAVDFGQAKQTIQGFGGSEAWSPKMADGEINRLFGQGEDDLGLSIMRIRIAPLEWDNAKKQVGDKGAWVAELENAKDAQALGAKIFATPWTPPMSMKTNTSSRKENNYSGNLAQSSYGDYARYLNTYIDFAKSRGVNLHAISIQNEPDFDPKNYESCLWDAESMATWAAGHGADAVGNSGVKLIASEAYGFGSEWSDVLLANPASANNINIIGGHLYGVTPSYPTTPNIGDKELWMTEHDLESKGKNGDGTWRKTIDDALQSSIEIHKSMAIGQYNAYVWWWMVNGVNAEPRGLMYNNSKELTYHGYGMKHFSRYIRPGYRRYAATSQPIKDVYLSAYAEQNGNHKVMVVINNTNQDITLPIAVQNATNQAPFTLYQTSGSERFANKGSVFLTGNTLNARLPAKSISTYAQ